jgi:asparagine synthase (glutamine-hydrolysing)
MLARGDDRSSLLITRFFARGKRTEIHRPGAFCGVWDVPEPAEALRQLGAETVWQEDRIAFGGAPVWTDRLEEIVVSGEVVLSNTAELRAELDRPEAVAGELLAELIRCYGMNAGKYALGMFAVAAFDRRKGELHLLRDSVGGRTLYYADAGRQGCWFSGRLQPLRKSPVVSREISLPALQHYLTCAFVPGEQTMWRDARELSPGTVLSLPGRTRHTYWEPREGEWDTEEPLESCARRLRPLLEEAVQCVLPDSGPTGVFLSGGLDSSLITALAKQVAPGEVHTFAVHFGPEYRNELEFSSLVAAHCGTHHHIVELPGKVIRDHLLETLALLDDPIGDPLTTPNLLLARAAAKETGVVLNGEGGDPCFGGPKNLPMLLHTLYGQVEPCESAYLRSYQKCYDDLPRLLTPDIQAALKERPETLFTPFFDERRMSSYLNRLMWINVRLKGADHILTKVNNLTTATGLLAHAPLFDRRIVEMSFSIPPDYKLTGATEKAVLKRAVADLLPETILSRPKSGMLVPVQGWFRKELKHFARHHLLGRHARTRPYFNLDVVREWLDYKGSLFPRHGVKLWLLLTLELWLRAQEEG